MKYLRIFVIFTLFVSAAFGQKAVVAPLDAPFTYQGKLLTNGIPASGDHDFLIKLCDDPEAGRCTDHPAVTAQVMAGIFTLTLDFTADAFADIEMPKYLDISVRLQGEGEGEYTTLTPRQRVAFAPLAQVSHIASISKSVDCTNCIANTQIVSIAGSKVTGTVANATNAVNATNAQTAVSAANAANSQNAVNAQNANHAQTADFASAAAGTLKWNVVGGTSQQAASGNGYITVNTGQTTVTLPASPAAGDVIRVWAQGDGGFRIAQNAGQRIMESNIRVPTFNFTPRESNRNWWSITSSADGAKLAAVVSNGQIHTSTDSGVTWTARESNRIWTSIASSADGTKLAAAAFNGRIYTSTDSGQTWLPRAPNLNWFSITSSADGTKLAAVVNNGQIWTSADSGVTWTAKESNRNWYSITSSADGTKLAAAGQNTHIYTSTDSGVTWTARESNRFWRSIASSADGTRLAAVVGNVSGGQIYTSNDSGVTWTARESNRQWYSIASSADGTKLAAVAFGGQIYTSTDSGVTWTARESNRWWASIASSADGSKLAAVIGDGGSGQIYTSTTETISLPATTVGTGGALFGEKNASVELVYIGSGQFIAVTATGNFHVQ